MAGALRLMETFVMMRPHANQTQSYIRLAVAVAFVGENKSLHLGCRNMMAVDLAYKTPKRNIAHTRYFDRADSNNAVFQK